MMPPLPITTCIGKVHYTLSNLTRQIDFYQSRLGFKLLWQTDNSAGLGAGTTELLRFTEQKAIQNFSQRGKLCRKVDRCGVY
jgi:catechol-2,3-dioxygenase